MCAPSIPLAASDWNKGITHARAALILSLARSTNARAVLLVFGYILGGEKPIAPDARTFQLAGAGYLSNPAIVYA